MLLVERLDGEDLEKKEIRTSNTGIIVGSSKSDAMKEDQYVRFKVLAVPSDLHLQPHLSEITVGCVVGVEYNAQRGVGIENKYLVPAGMVKYIMVTEDA